MFGQYIIGKIGESPRMILTGDEENARMQVDTDEVMFQVANVVPPPCVIAPDGLSLIAAARPFQMVKDQRWVDARQYRDSVANDACSTQWGAIQTNDSSKLRVNGAVAMAMLAKTSGQTFSINWTMLDNSVVTLDADDMIAVGVAVGQYIAACQDAGTQIRLQIDAATDQQSLDAIDITAGYPTR